MAPPSSRPLTTYSRRRARSGRVSHDVLLSSPIRPLSPDAEDVSFALMAQRMNKRARLAVHSSISDGATSAAQDTDGKDKNPSKRSKALLAESSQLTLGDAPMLDDYMLDHFSQTSLQVSTPLQAMPSDHCMVLSSTTRPSVLLDQPSPLPVAKRILSRTSSRNFKENAGQRGSRPLASPFNSRPASRTASPKITSRKRSGRHAKTRTHALSGALREKSVDRNVSSHIARFNADSRLHSVGSLANHADTLDKSAVPVHHRTSSIPNLKPALDHISSEAWLIPPKALSRSPTAADSDMEGENLHIMDLQLDHSSFLRDAPIHASTPPRRNRSATVGAWAQGLMPQIDADPPLPVRSLQYDSDVDMTDSSRAGSPSVPRASRANPPRRRRRTIVHLPSDSLFSSSLDFSSLMSGTERFPRPPASEGSRSPELSLSEVNSALAPAFSLHSSPVGLAHGAAYETSMTFARLGSSKAKLGAPVGNGGPPVLPLSAGFNTRSAPPTCAADGDELLDLFSILGLDEDEKWGPFAGADDSGVAFPDADPQGPEPPSKGGRVTRKRGDTIRASDFAKMPASASFDGSSGSSLASAQRVPPRRARSGTVMQATSSGSGRRKHEGWPTIKMRTTEEPLRVDGDEADDELLLKDGDVVD